MTRDEMWHKACERFEEWACKYADKNVTDEQFFNELCCSVYAGEEFKKPDLKKPVLDEGCSFMYRGYNFELTTCKMPTSSTDRYVCWMFGHKDNDGHTLDEYLELCPNETEQDNCWVEATYLVPGAWSWGASYDCTPGYPVQDLILEYIDKFLEQNPDL